MGAFSSWLNGLATASAGGTVYNSILVQDGVPKKSPALMFGQIPRLYVVANRDLALTDTRGGILTSSLAGTTIFKLPTMYALGFLRNAANPMELTFAIQRGGTGALVMGYHLYLGTVASQAAMVALNPVSLGDYVIRSDDSNSVYRNTAAPSSNAANWTKIVGSPANKPTASGIVVQWNDLDPQYLPKDHPPVMLTSNGLDSWVAS